jgi:hypothetical protein
VSSRTRGKQPTTLIAVILLAIFVELLNTVVEKRVERPCQRCRKLGLVVSLGPTTVHENTRRLCNDSRNHTAVQVSIPAGCWTALDADEGME